MAARLHVERCVVLVVHAQVGLGGVCACVRTFFFSSHRCPLFYVNFSKHFLLFLLWFFSLRSSPTASGKPTNQPSRPATQPATSQPRRPAAHRDKQPVQTPQTPARLTCLLVAYSYPQVPVLYLHYESTTNIPEHHTLVPGAVQARKPEASIASLCCMDSWQRYHQSQQSVTSTAVVP
jgi:hypothetical protein